MQVNIRGDSVEITGYVNAIERNSKPLTSRIGRFIERICKGAFSNALKRNDDIHILLNHDYTRDLGSTRQGNLELCEDSIGLKARAVITDAEVIGKAREGRLVGWSFGFYDVEGGVESGFDEETRLPLRKLRDLFMTEVSILDDTKTPAYDGTLVAVRDNEETVYFSEPLMEDIEIREEKTEEREEKPEEEKPEEKPIDYSVYEQLINEIKA